MNTGWVHSLESSKYRKRCEELTILQLQSADPFRHSISSEQLYLEDLIHLGSLKVSSWHDFYYEWV